ncbi:hypothetical protein D3C77_571980 [compost metagenome]
MPRLLASMMRFSIWSLMPRPWRPPMRLASSSSSTGSLYSTPFRATGWPSSKRTVTSSAFTATSSRQNAMMGLTMRMPEFSCSRSLASWVAPSRLESVE